MKQSNILLVLFFVTVCTSIPLAYGTNSVSGMVVDEGLNPFPSATVVAHGDGGSTQTHSDADGRYTIQNLPDDVYSMEVNPPIGTYYVSAGDKAIELGPNEDLTRLAFVILSGSTLSGYAHDSLGHPIEGLEISVLGTAVEGLTASDSSGYYEFNVPPGTVYVQQDEISAEYSFNPQVITVPGIGMNISASNITAYTESDGAWISGSITNPGGFSHAGDLAVAAFKHDFIFDQSLNLFLLPLSLVTPGTAAYTVSGLPPAATYDVVFGVFSVDEATDIARFIGRAIQSNVAPETAGIDFTYDTAGQAITGTVIYRTQSIIDADIYLTTPAGEFRGVTSTDAAGAFTLPNVATGSYTLIACHAGYTPVSQTVTVPDAPVNLAPMELIPITTLKLTKTVANDMKLTWLHQNGSTYDIYYNTSPDTNSAIRAEQNVSPGPDGLNTWIDDGTQTGTPPEHTAIRVYHLGY